MIRKVALFAILSLLTSCAGHSSPRPDLGVHPKRLDPALCVPAPVEPTLPADASITRPVTDAERAGVSAYLGFVHDLALWGRGLAKRADKTAASEVCR